MLHFYFPSTTLTTWSPALCWGWRWPGTRNVLMCDYIPTLSPRAVPGVNVMPWRKKYKENENDYEQKIHLNWNCHFMLFFPAILCSKRLFLFHNTFQVENFSFSIQNAYFSSIFSANYSPMCADCSALLNDQSKASIQVTWSLWTNQRPLYPSPPIRGQYPGHVTALHCWLTC